MKQTALVVCLVIAGCGGTEDTQGDADDADVVEDVVEEDAAEEEPSEAVEPPALEVLWEPLTLTDGAWEALAEVPDWLQDDLAINLAKLPPTIQEELATLILDLADPDLMDEVAFAMAHTSPEVIQHGMFFPELFVLNAELIYAYDPLLDYVTIENVGVPGVDPDFYSTLTYRVENDAGTVEDRTIDPEMYYWYVVHPRLEDELPWYVDGWTSGSGVRPDMGWFWREFLWDAAAEDCPTDRVCPLLRDTMAGVEVFRRRAEDSAFSTDARDAVEDFVDAALDWGAGTERPVQPNRIYVVACGNCGEYADFRVSSARTALMPSRNTGASSNDHTWGEWWYEGVGWHGETWFYKNGIRRDRRDNDCDGQADDGLLDTDEDGDGVTVAGGDCDDTLDTVHPGATEVQNGYDDDCDGWADTGFTDADLDGDGDGVSITAGDCDDTLDTVHPSGTEIANGRDDDCDTVADDGADTADADSDGHTIAAGDCNDHEAAVYPGATESTNGVDDDCDGTADDGTDTADSDSDGHTILAGDCDDTDDAIFPGAAEIANGVDDDCDGTADEGADAADGDSDGHTIAAGDCDDADASVHPGATDTGNARDDDCDGTADEGLSGSDRDGDGYTMAGGDCNDLIAGFHPGADDPRYSSNRLYAITSARGDSHLDTTRTEVYATLPSYLAFDVLDRSGDPVDGALVTIYGTWEVYGHPEAWAVASEVVTDLVGHAEITVGEANPYGYAVTSGIGDTPGGDHLFRAVERTEPFETYPVTAAVPGEMPEPAAATEADLTAGADPELTLSVSFDVESYRTAQDGRLYGSFSWEQDGGHLDAYLVDETNYSLFRSGDPFQAALVSVDAADGVTDHALPRTKTWYLVLSNADFIASTMVGSVSLAAAPAAGISWTGDAPELTYRFRIPPGEHVCITLTP